MRLWYLLFIQDEIFNSRRLEIDLDPDSQTGFKQQ